MDLLKIFNAQSLKDVKTFNRTIVVRYVPTVVDGSVKYAYTGIQNLFQLPNRTAFLLRKVRITSSPNDYFKDCFFNDLTTAQINILDGETKAPLNEFPIKLCTDEIELNIYYEPSRGNNKNISVRFDNTFSIANPSIPYLDLCLNFEIYQHRTV